MFLTEYSFIQTPFNDANRPVSINCKYYGINNFNESTNNKKSIVITLHLNIVFSSKSFDNLYNLLAL